MANAARDIEAERAVLYACCYSPKAAAAASQRLLPRHFYLRAHQKAYEAILALQARGGGADLVTLVAELRAGGELEACGGPAAISAMLESGAAPENVLAHAAIVRNHWATRERMRVGLEMANGTAADAAAAQISAGRLLQINQEAAGEAAPSPIASAAAWSSNLSGADLVRPQSLLGDGILCRGDLGLIAGAPGRGKSRLAIELGVSMARCENWLGLPTTVSPARVVYVAAEFTRFRWVERCVQLMRGSCPREGDALLESFQALELSRDSGLFHGIPGETLASPLNLLNVACAGHLAEIISLFSADLLILDPLSRMMNGQDESNEFFGLVIQTLDQVRFRTGAAVLLVHHVRKGGNDPNSKDDPLDMIRGGTKLRDGVNSAMFLSMTGSGTLRLEFPKANYASKPDPIFHRIPEDGSRTILAESPEDILSGNRKKISDWVAANPNRTQNDIASGTKLSLRTVRSHLAFLVSKNELSAANEGKRSKTTYLQCGKYDANGTVAAFDDDIDQGVMDFHDSD